MVSRSKLVAAENLIAPTQKLRNHDPKAKRVHNWGRNQILFGFVGAMMKGLWLIRRVIRARRCLQLEYVIILTFLGGKKFLM